VKVHMVSEHASPLALIGGVDAGGQNVHVAELARRLGARDVEVVVHTRRDDPQMPRRVALAPNVVVDHVTAGPACPLPKDELFQYMDEFAEELVQQWTADPPDAVHSHFWMSGYAALSAARRVGVPLTHTYHALGIVKRRQQGTRDSSPGARIGIEQMLACEVDHIVATAHEEAEALLALGADPTRITVVPCGVDLTRFRARGVREPTPGGTARVVVLGRLVERKGVGNVIEAMASVPDAELVIAGGPVPGLLDDDADVARLRVTAQRFGVSDRVDVRGAVAREDVPALLRSADVVACCPWYEPFGMVALEAMACGRPVVASRVGGLAETVLDGVTGLHVAPRRPDQIAAAIRTLLETPSMSRQFGRAASRRAQRYSWDRVAGDTVDVYRQVHARAALTSQRRPA
jgi:D-inositol-3-phosphate glycosyltransferase